MKKILSVLLILIIIITSQVYFFTDYDLWDEIINYEENLEKIKISLNEFLKDSTKEEDLEKEELLKEDIDKELSLEELELTDDIENIKKQFYEALLNGDDEFTYEAKNLTINEFEKLDIQSVVSENPDSDLGYRGVNFEYSYVDPYIKEVKFTIDYFQKIDRDGKSYDRLTKNDLLLKREKLDKSIDQFLSKYINSFMTDLEKEIAVHDYIVKNAEYNYESLSENIVSVDNYNAYGILINGRGVCDGYAKAFYVLGKAAGLDVIYLAGTARNESGIMGHAWNLIKLDGDWYTVDSTWNDPVFIDGNKPNDFASYDYFNVTDEMISKSHFRNPEYSHYPESKGTKYGRDALMEEDIIRNSNNRTRKQLLPGEPVND